MGDGRTGTQVRKFTIKSGDTVLYNKFGIGATDLLCDVSFAASPLIIPSFL